MTNKLINDLAPLPGGTVNGTMILEVEDPAAPASYKGNLQSLLALAAAAAVATSATAITASAASTLAAAEAYADAKLQIQQYAMSDRVTALAAATDVAGYTALLAHTIHAVGCDIDTTSSSGAVSIDVKINGTTIFTTQPSIASGQHGNVNAGGTAAVITGGSAAVAIGDRVTFDIVNFGTGAKGLVGTLAITVP